MAQNRRPEAEAQPESSYEEEEGSSEESEEQEDNDLTLFSKKPSAMKKPDATLTAAHPQSSSEDDSESEYESEPDSPPNITSRSGLNVKPITAKPMKEAPKATKKPRSEPTSDIQAAKSSATAIKRPVESENNDGRESKRAKKKTGDAADGNVNNDTEKKNGDDVKKQLFQRLWSEADEIVILKGMIEYRAKKGADPMSDLNAFQDFIKKSLHVVDVSKIQFSTKVRRLKKKYENNLTRGKNGQDRSFSNPHEQKTYDLSKKIWGGCEANDAEVENLKAIGKGRKNQKVSPNEDGLASPDKAMEGTGREVESNTGANQSFWFGRIMGVSSLEEVIMKDGLELVSGPKKIELQEKWKQFRVDEVELYLKRLDLIREQTKLVLEALKSPRH